MSFIKKIIIILGGLLGLAYATTQNYNLDPTHTYVEWRINHFGFSNPSGKWIIESGVLSLDEKKITNSSVRVSIQIDSMLTGIPKLDDHLMSSQFFDIKQFPTATFISTSVKQKSAKKLIIVGNLTVHGVTKPVTLNATLNKIDMSPVSLHKTAGFSATTQIKRSDFGMKAYLPGLSDNVDIIIEAEAMLPNESETKSARDS